MSAELIYFLALILTVIVCAVTQNIEFGIGVGIMYMLYQILIQLQKIAKKE